MMTRFREWVGQGLEYLALALALLAASGITAIVLIIVVSVFMRKFANAPFYFTEEVVGLLLSVSLFLALPMVTLKAKHVHVSILVSYMDGWKRRFLKVLGGVIGVVFCTWIFVEAIPWMEFALRLNLKTETSRILLYPWMAVLPFATLLTGVIFLARLFGVIPDDDNGAPSGH
ncbi:MAG: TRAP transporter small permease [Hyphomicrobiales bacterium]